MKKILIYTLVLTFSVSSLFAQDQKAKGILDKLSVKTKTYKTIKAEFVFKIDNSQEDISESYKGTVWVKGDKYKVDLMGAVNYFDGKDKYTYLKDANEVNITEPDEDDDESLNPSTIFTMYNSGFKYKFINEKFEGTRALYEIDLYPIDLEKEYSRIKLKVDKTKNEIYSIKQYGKDGNYYTIKILKFIPNVNMTDAMFTFDKSKHIGVEVNDMR